MPKPRRDRPQTTVAAVKLISCAISSCVFTYRESDLKLGRLDREDMSIQALKRLASGAVDPQAMNRVFVELPADLRALPFEKTVIFMPLRHVAQSVVQLVSAVDVLVPAGNVTFVVS